MKSSVYTNKIKNLLLDMLFPSKCIGCKVAGEMLCMDCVSKIERCGRETDKNIIAMFDYRDPLVKNIIWELKYHHKRYIGEKLGKLLYEYMVEDISDMKIDVAGRSILVIPVPISNKKTRLRGYNQTIAISKGFCHQTDNELELKENIVIKKVDTIAQAKITNRKRRLENVRDVFDIKNKEIVKGRTIIVIDDVTTTGGTILEIIKILKKAGAKKVIGFAVAH